MQSNEKTLLIIEYNPLWRILSILLRLFAIFSGLNLLLVDNYFVQGFGVILILFGVLDFFNIIFFNKLSFFENELVKESNNFLTTYRRRLQYSQTEVSVSKRLFGGRLMFWEKGNKMNTTWFFVFDLMPVTNDEFKEIKNILTEKGVIEGDELAWNI